MKQSRWGKWSRWSLLLAIVAGCNAKLSVEPNGGAGAGGKTLGESGRSGSTAGAGPIDHGTAGTVASGGAEAGYPDTAGAAGYFIGHAGGTTGGAPGGGAPAGGAAGAPPQPGEIGQKCIPGETLTSGSGVAEAQIKTLDRCNSGLACNAARKCAAVPSCPSTTSECVVQEVLGVGGASNPSSSYGGTGGTYLNTTGGAPNAGPPIVTAESGISALAIDATRLYWLEYGTRDSLGNYQNDGALKAMNLADGTTTVIASALAGPNALAVTSSHAYVFLDGAGFIGSEAHLKLLRFPLSGGSSEGGSGELIQDGWTPLSAVQDTVAVGSTLYWTGSAALFSLTSDSTTPVVVHDAAAQSLHADSSDLYFQPQDTYQLVRTPLSAPGPLQTLGVDVRPFDLNGDSLYGLENTFDNNGSAHLLTKAAKTNGTWQRIRALGSGYAQKIVFVGARYFVEWTDSSNATGITTAQLDDSTLPVQLITPGVTAIKDWLGSADKLYWSDGRRILSRPVAGP